MLDRLQKVFASFEKNDVRYVIIGGIAVVLHGVPRLTLDLDILIEPTPENAERLLKALLDAGFVTAGLTTSAQLLENEITVFDDVERIDVQTRTPGIAFADAWNRHELFHIQDMAVRVISRADLIASKRAAGRPVDIEDVRALEMEK